MASHMQGLKRAHEDDTKETLSHKNTKKRKLSRRRPPLAKDMKRVLGAMIGPLADGLDNVAIYRSFYHGALFDKNLMAEILQFMPTPRTSQVVESKSIFVRAEVHSMSVDPIRGDIWIIDGHKTIQVYDKDHQLKIHINELLNDIEFQLVSHFEDGQTFVTSRPLFRPRIGEDSVHTITLMNGHYDRKLLFRMDGISCHMAIIKDRNGLPLIALRDGDNPSRYHIFNRENELQHKSISAHRLCAVRKMIYIQPDNIMDRVIEYNPVLRKRVRICSSAPYQLHIISMGEAVGVLNGHTRVLRIYRGSIMTHDIKLEISHHEFGWDLHYAFCPQSRRLYYEDPEHDTVNYFVVDL